MTHPRRRIPPARAALACALALSIAACSDFPRDPEGTLERARGGELRVGVAQGVTPAEQEVVARLAASLEARVAWELGGAPDLLGRLERRELDIVIAGLEPKTPWKGRVALSRPLRDGEGRERVVATSPGENALLVAVERVIGARR